MPNEIEYFQNPGPWHMYPGSNHVVDADGNTVCTIAPDCSNAAIAIVQNAPEAVKLLGEIVLGFAQIADGKGQPTIEEAAAIGDKITEAFHFMQQAKLLPHG